MISLTKIILGACMDNINERILGGVISATTK